MKVCLYARCSTDENDRLQTTETQLYQLKDHCKRHDIEIVDTIEEYASGKDMDGREKFQALIERAELSKRVRGFDAIMCLRLDRFTRNVLDGLKLIDRLSKAECDLIFLHEKYDTTTPMGKMFFTISLSWAQMYREELSDKVSEGIERWKRENPGRVWGQQVRDDVDLGLAVAILNGDGESRTSLRKTAEKLGVPPSTLVDHLDRAGYVRNPTTKLYGIPDLKNEGSGYISAASEGMNAGQVSSEQQKEARR